MRFSNSTRDISSTLAILCFVAASFLLSATAHAEDRTTFSGHSQELLDEIIAARTNREDAIAGTSVKYRVRTPNVGWRDGFWASAPNGDVHAVGPLPPHALFEEQELWPVVEMTHEVRQSPITRVWSREDLNAGITEITIEPGATNLRERIAGHPLIYDLAVDRWFAMDNALHVEETEYDGRPAAFVRSGYGHEAWLLRDYDWAVAELHDITHNWVVRASNFDRLPLINGAAPQVLEWSLDDDVILEIALDDWEPAQPDAIYAPVLEVGSGDLHVVDRRVSPAAGFDLPDLESVSEYLAEGTLPDDATPLAHHDEVERVVFVINATEGRKKFSLDNMPTMNFGIIEDNGEHFGYLAYQDPEMEPFSPTQIGDVFLMVDQEEWRPQSREDISWLLGRFTWMTLWDKPFTVTVLRDGKLIEFEFVWSYEDTDESDDV